MKTLELNRMGLESLSFEETADIYGGGFWSILAKIGLCAAVVGVALATFGLATAGLYVGGAGLIIFFGSCAGVIESQ